MVRALGTNSKFYYLSEKARKEIIKLKAEGRSYQYITDYINNTYPTELVKGRLKLSNVVDYIKNRGINEITALQKRQSEDLIKSLNDNLSMSKLVSKVCNNIELAEKRGEVLPLKDSMQLALKIWDLAIKANANKQKDDGSKEAKEVIERLKTAMNKPTKSVTETVEIEYDKEGSVTKKKATKTTNKEEKEETLDDIDEEDIIEGEVSEIEN